jgi:protein involved in polysaccharide export with SLBB domain
MASWDRFVVLLAAALLLVAAAAGARAEPGSSSIDLQVSQAIGIAGTPAAAAGPTQPGAYRIGAGDKVSVTVYREPDLSLSDAKVGPDGSIAFPLLGDLHVAGLTSKELQRLVTERLADGFLKQPNVIVNVDRQQLYFIKGEVSAPGGYTYVEGLTVEKAVALAGGFTERAAKDDITVVREGTPTQPMRTVPPGLQVLPGDVITVEESFF